MCLKESKVSKFLESNNILKSKDLNFRRFYKTDSSKGVAFGASQIVKFSKDLAD